jgi:hypothetical protein
MTKGKKPKDKKQGSKLGKMIYDDDEFDYKEDPLIIKE